MQVYLAGTSTRLYLYESIFGWRERQDTNAETLAVTDRQTDRQTDNLRRCRFTWQETHTTSSHGAQNRTEQNRTEALFILDSFYACRDNQFITNSIPLFADFLLDSGAFTFMSNKNVRLDWDRYTEEYAEYVTRNKVEHFIELDIDVVVGLKEVERLRAKLERLTGKQPIPVWHKSRGKQYFVDMCKDYPYVALGGYATKEIPQKAFEQAFPWFINTAHENGAKIHGLGYTSCANLRKYHFDSVDSTAWLYGNLGGYLYFFNSQIDCFFSKVNVKNGQRLKARASAEHNFNEWRKLQRFANKYL